MASKSHAAILRLTDSSGEKMLCCCAPKDGDAILCIGNPESHELRKASGIIVDTTAPIQITNSKDAYALSAWLSAAAVWLRMEELEESGE